MATSDQNMEMLESIYHQIIRLNNKIDSFQAITNDVDRINRIVADTYLLEFEDNLNIEKLIKQQQQNFEIVVGLLFLSLSEKKKQQFSELYREELSNFLYSTKNKSTDELMSNS